MIINVKVRVISYKFFLRIVNFKIDKQFNIESDEFIHHINGFGYKNLVNNQIFKLKELFHFKFFILKKNFVYYLNSWNMFEPTDLFKILKFKFL